MLHDTGAQFIAGDGPVLVVLLTLIIITKVGIKIGKGISKINKLGNRVGIMTSMLPGNHAGAPAGRRRTIIPVRLRRIVPRASWTKRT